MKFAKRLFLRANQEAMYKRIFITAAISAASLTAPSPALASPVEFVFHDTVGSWAPCILNSSCPLIPGVNFGDLVTVRVIADNGNSSLTAQTWSQSDVISATASVGTYTGTFNTPYYSYDPIFRTNLIGEIEKVAFFDIDIGNTDNLGNSVLLASNALISARSDNTYQYYVFFQNGISASNPNYWSFKPVTSVPTPPTLLLILTTLAALRATRPMKDNAEVVKRKSYNEPLLLTT